MLCLGLHQSDAQIMVQLQVLPPYSPYLSDYTSRPNSMVISVTNTTAQPRTIYFSGSVTGDNGVSAQTKANFKPTYGLQISPNSTMQFTGAQLSPLFNWDMGTLQGVNTQQVERSGMLPQGNYRICVEVRDFNTGMPIGTVRPLCSQTFSITATQQPPVINQPSCGSTIDPTSGQILFSWTPAMPKPASVVEYRLRIVEVVPPSRNINDALGSMTTPPAFEVIVPSTSYLLNPMLLRPSQSMARTTYAFNVTAIDRTHQTTFANNGVSQACYFRLGRDSGRGPLYASVVGFPGTPITDTTLPAYDMTGDIACGTSRSYVWTNNTTFKVLILVMESYGDCPASCDITVAPTSPAGPGKTTSRPPAVTQPQPNSGKQSVRIFNAPPPGGTVTFRINCGSGSTCSFRFSLEGTNEVASSPTTGAPGSVSFDTNNVSHNPAFPYSRCQTLGLKVVEITNDVGSDITVSPFDVKNEGQCRMFVNVQVGGKQTNEEKLNKGQSVNMKNPKDKKGNYKIKKGQKLTVTANCDDTEQDQSNCAGTVSGMSLN
jgi:TANFOR domain-containing protein